MLIMLQKGTHSKKQFFSITLSSYFSALSGEKLSGEKKIEFTPSDARWEINYKVKGEVNQSTNSQRV
jgi:hypothetical protein